MRVGKMCDLLFNVEGKLMSIMVQEALKLIYSYLYQNYRRDELKEIENELISIVQSKSIISSSDFDVKITYEDLQEKL
jgi:hypothetical protein